MEMKNQMKMLPNEKHKPNLLKKQNFFNEKSLICQKVKLKKSKKLSGYVEAHTIK